jgi:membrane protease YdiL (CAAX protease family)
MIRRSGTRLALASWLALIGAVAAIGYASRATEGKPDANVLYRWSTFEGLVVQYLVIGALIWGIARIAPGRGLFALRRPTSWRIAAAIGIAVIAGMMILSGVLGPILHPGQEQGLTPSRWEPQHAAEYVFNGLAIGLLAPVVEELAFRGLGFSLLRQFGRWPAIAGVGIAFGLWHGLVEALPLLVALGMGLAYLRSRVDSVYPGMVVHALFNAAALVYAVAH